MDFTDFKQSLASDERPEGLSQLLRGLWHGGRGDWDQAHRIVQAIEGPDAAWIHAWLHRQEGDDWNAGYWYKRAGRPHCHDSLEKEWETIAAELLRDAPAS